MNQVIDWMIDRYMLLCTRSTLTIGSCLRFQNQKDSIEIYHTANSQEKFGIEDDFTFSEFTDVCPIEHGDHLELRLFRRWSCKVMETKISIHRKSPFQSVFRLEMYGTVYEFSIHNCEEALILGYLK